jgi:leucyl aminopeptidase
VIANLTDEAAGATPIWPLTAAGLGPWVKGKGAPLAAWVAAARFTAQPGTQLLAPAADGALSGVLVGVPDSITPWAFADLPRALPAGSYRIDPAPAAAMAGAAALGWALGSYDFSRYRAPQKPAQAKLAWPAAADRKAVERAVRATFLVRDLVNTPANDMGPAELADAAVAVAHAGGGRADIIVGDDLLARNYPLVHAVGRASARAPRLIDFVWGRPDAPKVTLVGKGVCFDTGGLDLKPSSNMALMKKDMGGAATVLGLAQMIMDAGLDLRLRVLIPAVENAVAGNAYRPGDVLATRKGKTVELGNTDAEGRLVLADALTEADGEDPALLIDCATLTGAARVALGPDLPALFTPSDDLARDILRHGEAEADPLWRMPLHAPYRDYLDSKVADFNNASETPFAGSITAALFLKEFVSQTPNWAHVDLYAWNAKAKPGRPVGGEAMAMRALFALVAERHGG